jgi:hypothetical protein
MLWMLLRCFTDGSQNAALFTTRYHQIEENEMCGACNGYGTDGKCVHDFGLNITLNFNLDPATARATAQAVSRWLPTAAGRIQTRV